MKLYDLLKLMDGLNYVVLWHEDEDEEPVFKGLAMDVPFVWTRCKLDNTVEDGAISLRDDLGDECKYSDGRPRAGLVICIKG
jgi:hypothetical protein